MYELKLDKIENFINKVQKSREGNIFYEKVEKSKYNQNIGFKLCFNVFISFMTVLKMRFI